MKIAWITDPHLDFLHPSTIVAFAKTINYQEVDGIFITGDISTSKLISSHLSLLHDTLKCPVYFVLGNHDYYYADIHSVKVACDNLSTTLPDLHFMDVLTYVDLTDKTAVVGCSGFYDCLAGNPHSTLDMSDFSLNADLKNMRSEDRKAKCLQISTEMTKQAKQSLLMAANYGYKNVYFLTHVPPFEEACIHEGKISEGLWLPWFTNITLGHALLDIASEYKDTNFTVLCGHTHGYGEYNPLENLKVLTGAAEYGYPCVWKYLDIE